VIYWYKILSIKTGVEPEAVLQSIMEWVAAPLAPRADTGLPVEGSLLVAWVPAPWVVEDRSKSDDPI
jgi:hypothetical protein